MIPRKPPPRVPKERKLRSDIFLQPRKIAKPLSYWYTTAGGNDSGMSRLRKSVQQEITNFKCKKIVSALVQEQAQSIQKLPKIKPEEVEDEKRSAPGDMNVAFDTAMSVLQKAEAETREALQPPRAFYTYLSPRDRETFDEEDTAQRLRIERIHRNAVLCKKVYSKSSRCQSASYCNDSPATNQAVLSALQHLNRRNKTVGINKSIWLQSKAIKQIHT